MHYEVKESDIFDFARLQSIQTKERGDEIQFQFCPYCHGGNFQKDKGTFSVNRKTGQFKCMRASCGATGNMITLARDFDFKLTDDFSNYYRKRPTYRKIQQPTKPIVPLPPALAFLEKRGIGESTATAYNVTTHKENDNVLVFPIYDAAGTIVNIKYRNLNYTNDKKNGSKEWFHAGCQPYLFGVQTWNHSFDRMVLYEGQLDAMSGYEAGIENSFSVPGGARGFTWWPASYDFVSQFKEIVIFGDYEKGHVTLVDEMKQRYSGAIRCVKPDDYKDCKDANEIILKYGKEQVRKCVDNATLLPIADVIELADVQDVDISKMEKLQTGIKAVDDLLYGGLPFGGVHLISGKPGEGKSTLASQILVNAISKGYKCFSYSGELPNFMFKAWINYQIAGGNHVYQSGDGIHENIGYSISAANRNVISEWYRGKAFIYDNSSIDSNEHLGLIEATEKAIQRYGCRVILIDNLMTALDMEMMAADDKYERQSKFVKKLARIAIRYNVIILLVAHKRKNNFSQNENDEVSGSGDITNLGMVTIAYEKSKDLDDSQRLIKVSKNRLFGKTNTIGFKMQFDERSKRIFGDGDDPYREYGCFSDAEDGFTPISETEDPVFD